MPEQVGLVAAVGGRVPQVAATAWVAPGATVVGAVTLGDRASVWYGSVLRADTDPVSVGAESNIQDLSVLHADPGFPCVVGAGVSVGHRAVLHGCTVEDGVLVGMGAVVLNGARVGRGSLVAAGAVVLGGTEIPPGSLVAGMPAKVRRPLTDGELDDIRRNAAHYVELLAAHRSGPTVS